MIPRKSGCFTVQGERYVAMAALAGVEVYRLDGSDGSDGGCRWWCYRGLISDRGWATRERAAAGALFKLRVITEDEFDRFLFDTDDQVRSSDEYAEYIR